MQNKSKVIKVTGPKRFRPCNPEDKCCVSRPHDHADYGRHCVCELCGWNGRGRQADSRSPSGGCPECGASPYKRSDDTVPRLEVKRPVDKRLNIEGNGKEQKSSPKRPSPEEREEQAPVEALSPYEALKAGFLVLCQQYESIGKQLAFMSECLGAIDYEAQQVLLRELKQPMNLHDPDCTCHICTSRKLRTMHSPPLEQHCDPAFYEDPIEEPPTSPDEVANRYAHHAEDCQMIYDGPCSPSCA